ncbi:hypothetical protein K2173_016772 [Erythroxylum novogranatense]|uniref:glutathione transferase n=1 Tax=Erythroxylum novogranatense TaxID=1862640 RepID=A0AAV8SH02_9ROSI|nr:hypothetical protein K2173_016772 [Erythroxylum novogranatense]
MSEEVKLLGTSTSPFSFRVKLALELKGVQYEYIEENLSNKSSLLLEYNPVHKKIPVLVHNGKPIAESQVILQYIDETWKANPIQPEDAYDRAVARFWAKFVDDTLMQTGYKSMRAKGEELEEIMGQVCDQLKSLENELKGKEFFGGGSIGLVDIVAFSVTYWFQVWQEATEERFLTEDKFPVLCSWIEKLSHIEVVKGCLLPKENHVARARARIEAIKSASK